jgi:cell division protein FtsQ
MAVFGLAAGSLWLIAHPFWLLRSGAQIQVEGNEMLSDEAVQALLPLDYPQSLLAVQPDKLAQQLTAHPPIAAAQVNRQLFPPHLEITLQERLPVAVTVPSHPQPAGATPAESTPTNQPGLVDIEGNWMAQDNSLSLDGAFTLPELRVRGFNQRYQAAWTGLYEVLQSSPVSISEVDWRNPNNLILQTDLGEVHLGIYDPQRIYEQLNTLTQLRSLATKKNTPSLEYIDLSNPQNPAIKLTPSPGSDPQPQSP